jgi:serine/threonine protein kinase
MIVAMIGTTVGSYCVTTKVSIGGMGTVYKAEHVLIGKLAAVKVLHPELCNNRDIVNRFFNEAKATTQIKHPGIVEVFDFGYLPSGDAYIIMEFLEGMSLARRLEVRGRMEEGEAAMFLKSVCSALGAAHAKKIVHRDLKPDNIFLVPDPESATGERPKLLDFGIAKLTDVGLAGGGTKTGAVMGTPTYMSPEQCKGTGQVDHRADLYSLGCIYYELLCGRPPFIEEGAGELIGAHLYVQPASPRTHQPGISVESDKLIMSLLAKNPDDRPQTAKELAQRLSTIARKQGWITNTTPTGVTNEALRDLPDPDHASTTTPGQSGASQTPQPIETDHTLASDTSLRDVVPKPAEPLKTMSPTTLSGAASSIIEVPRSRRGMWAIALGAVLTMGAAVGFFAVRHGGQDAPRLPPAAKQPLATAPAPEVAPPTPAPALAPPTPAPALAPPTPAPAVTPPTPAPEMTPAATVAPAKPAIVKTPPPTKMKKTDKIKKPDVAKPVAPPKPDKGNGKGSGKILIETEI